MAHYIERNSPTQPYDYEPVARPSGTAMGRVWKVYTEAMDDGASFFKNVFKTVSTATSWIKFTNPACNEAYGNIGSFAKQAKNFMSIIDAPLRVQKLADSIKKFDIKTPFKSGLEVLDKGCGLVNNACDTLDFSNTYVKPVSTSVMNTAKLASAGATCFSSIKGSVESVLKIRNGIKDLSKTNKDAADEAISRVEASDKTEKTKLQITSQLISLAAKITFVALGAIGIAAAFVSVAPVVPLVVGTVGTLLGLASFFYDKVFDPSDDKAKKIMENPLFKRAAQLATTHA